MNRSSMNLAATHVLTAAMTAASVYWLDPSQGRRRRALLRDKLVSRFARARRAAGVTRRDVRHRLQGATARARSLMHSEHGDDEVLVERVRSALGRVTSHSGAIKVSCSQGDVVLSGPVLKHEHARVLRAAHSVAGVGEVQDTLTVCKKPHGISALQGGSRARPKQSFPILAGNGSPAARLAVDAIGASLISWGLTWGLRRDRPIGVVAAAVGGLMLIRSVTNARPKRRASGTGRRAIEIQKTIHIDAPVEQVFDTLAHYENFPFFMRHVRRVSTHPDGRSHWVVAGPGGISVEWDAETTVYRPNEVLAWRSVRNATVDNAGIMRLQRDRGGTRLDIHLTYSPPAGALGHAFAKFFRADAKTELDEDLLCLKTYLETGVPPRGATAWESAVGERTFAPVRPEPEVRANP